jgi:hypothetical protein
MPIPQGERRSASLFIKNMKGSALGLLTPEEVSHLPKKTLQELTSSAPSGERHFQMPHLIIPMLGNGFAPQRVFDLLRTIYAEDVTDNEIWKYIQWAADKPFQPTGAHLPAPRDPIPQAAVTTQKKLSPEAKLANAERFLKGFRCTTENLRDAWPVRVQKGCHHPETPLFFAFLYTREDGSEDPQHFINVFTDFKLDDKGRPMPVGAGKSLSRDGWTKHIREHGVPQGEAGAWFRPNPVRSNGSGFGGAYTDADVATIQYVLVESDCLPLELQASLLAQLPIPIVAIVDSGNRSLQAIVKIAEATEAKQLLADLAPFGIDQVNHNPSRLARLPGALRRIGARKKEGCYQELIYLDNSPIWLFEPDKPWKEQFYPRPGGTIL